MTRNCAAGEEEQDLRDTSSTEGGHRAHGASNRGEPPHATAQVSLHLREARRTGQNGDIHTHIQYIVMMIMDHYYSVFCCLHHHT